MPSAKSLLTVATLAIALTASQAAFAALSQDDIDFLRIVLASADQQTLSQSLALSKALSDEITRTKDKASIDKLQTSLNAQIDMQEGLVSMVRAISSNAEYLDLCSQIGASEIAMHASRNPQYITFQSNEGSGFDDHDGVQSLEELVRRRMLNGSIGGVVGNAFAQKAVIRHQAALQIARNPQAQISDRFFALKYLVNEGVAMAQR